MKESECFAMSKGVGGSGSSFQRNQQVGKKVEILATYFEQTALASMWHDEYVIS